MTATALRRHRPCRCPCLCTWRRCPTAGAAAWPPACCLHLTSQCSVPKRQKPFGVGGYNPSTVVSQGESARDIVKKGQERGLTIWAPCLFERFREERTRAGGRQRLRVRGLPLGWEWCVSAVSDSLVSSVLRAARVPKCRSQGSELWIRPVLISGYWTATTGPTTRPIGRDAVRDSADGHRRGGRIAIDRRRTGTLRLRGPRSRARMKRLIRTRLLITRYRYGHSELVWQADRGDQDPTLRSLDPRGLDRGPRYLTQ